MASQERKGRPKPWGAFHSEGMCGQDIEFEEKLKAQAVGCIGAKGAETRRRADRQTEVRGLK
jgi:hypothetical protein